MNISCRMSLLVAAGLVALSFISLSVPDAAAEPVTTLAVGDPQYDSSPLLVNDQTEFTLSASAPGASVTGIWYTWDDNPYIQYTGPFTAILYHPDTGGVPMPPFELIGEHTLYYNSSDNQGNHESPRSFKVHVDPTPPTTSPTFSGKHYHSGMHYISSGTTISLDAEDAASGVDMTYYGTTPDQFFQYSSPLSFTGSGSKTLYYYSTDNLGNTEQVQSIELFIDDTVPEIDITIGEPSYHISDTAYLSSGTPITLQASDDSGVLTIRYNVDGGSWSIYSGNLFLDYDGQHTLNYQAMDYLGNQGNGTIDIFLDNSPPNVNHSLPDELVITVDHGTELSFDSTDPENPDKPTTIYYSTHGGMDWTQYTSPIVLKEDVNITYYSEDALGNANPIETIHIKVNPRPYSQYYGYWLAVLIIGSAALIFVNRDAIFKRKDAPEPEEEPKKRKKRR